MTVGITELPPEGMQLGGVALAGDADRGTKTTEGLSLLFTTAGITVQGPQPQIERLLVWSGLDSASCREKIDLPDGRNAAVMELTSGGQSIRFLLPMDAVTPGQAAYLDQALPAWLARYKGTAVPAAAPPAPVTAPSNGGAGSAGLAASIGQPPPGDGVVTPTATPTPPSGPTPVEPPVAPAAAAAAGGVAAAASSSNGSVRGTTDSGSGTTGGSGPASPTTFGPPPSPAPSDPAPGASGAPGADPAAPPFVARSGAGMLPPSGPPPSAAPPPPNLPPPPAGLAGEAAPPAGAGGWSTPTDPQDGPTGWGNPPLTDTPADVTDPAQRSRGWRKNRPPTTPEPPTAPEPPTPSFFAPMQPPAEPPVDPTPLKLTTPLPPPPPEAPGSGGPVIWKPPIDPRTGEPVWDQSPEGLKSPPKKRKGWRRGAKDSAAVAAGAAAGATGAAAVADHTGAAASAPATVAPDGGAGSSAGTLPPITPDPALETPVGAPPPKSNRTMLVMLAVLLVAVIGGIAYFAVKRSSNTTPTTVASTPIPPRTAADTALAASLNLHLTDLPNGWMRSPAAVQPQVPPAPASAQIRAQQALSSCVAQPYALVAGLFGSATVPGASAAVNSPTFRSASDPGIQMASRSEVMGTVAGSQVQETPFVNPKFTTCYAQYQTALASAVVAGSTATVQQVSLPVPSGVRSFGYLTTFATPSGATLIKGEAFIFGGRTVNRLVPTTNGPAVPQSAFAAAYDSMTARVAQAVNK